MLKKASLILSVLLILSLYPVGVVNALPEEYLSNDIRYYKEECAPSSYGQSGSSGSSSGSAVDYKGREIYTPVQMEIIAQNQTVYENSAEKVGIPWQMIAVIHMRESGGKRENPSNGQGLYQFVNQQGGPYPTGPVDEAEFQRQTDLAAEFLLAKAGSKADQLKNGDANAIKYTFFAYNGIATVYKDQAKALGFSDEEAENGEGSPYVMNKADEKREPSSTWGQIKVDGGGIEYPANDDHGAFVAFVALQGGTTSICGTTQTNGDFVIYYQGDPKWAKVYIPTCSNTIDGCGCGPSSLAMVISTLTGDSSITPETMVHTIESLGGSMPMSWDSPELVATHYNMQYEALGTDISKIKQALKEGKYIIMSQSAGLFTGGGHIVALRGLTSDDRILVADPNDWNKVEGNQACSYGSGVCTTVPKDASEMQDINGDGRISYSEYEGGFSDADITASLANSWAIWK